MFPLVVITGSNTGIGFAAAAALCVLGWEVVLSSRSAEKGEAALAQLPPHCRCSLLLLDLTSLQSAAAFAEKVAERAGKERRVILVNNAGIMATPFAITEDGVEEQMQVNHLAHFLIVKKLLALKVNLVRVINVSSRAHFRYQLPTLDFSFSQRDPWFYYGLSKLSNILFASELARQGVEAVSLHPGLVKTQLLDKVGMKGSLSVEEGAKTTVFCVTAEKLTPGGYYVDEKESEERTEASKSEKLAAQLWQWSEERVAKFFPKEEGNKSEL